MKKVELKKILVPVDFTETSDIAMAEAISLAKLLNAKLFLIHVTEFDSFLIAPDYNIPMPPSEELEAVAKQKLGKVASKIESESGIRPEVHVSSGYVPEEIIQYSKKKNIDLILMGTHGASGSKEMFIGSNAQRVVTLSEIPVLTMQKKTGESGFKNILLPIDNSTHSREKVNLAMLIAELFNAKIHIIGLPDSKEKKELDKFNIKLKSVEKIIAADKLSYSVTMVGGESLAKAATDYAEQNKCDLIVINTGHESAITGIFLGAFHQQIVNHSKIPVLSMKHAADHFIIETPGFGI